MREVVFRIKRLLVSAFLNYCPPAYRLYVSPRRYAFIYRLHQPHERDFRALGLLPGGPSFVIDVGANIGQSILSIKSLYPKARVLAFEPHAGVSSRLMAVSRRFADVEVHRLALGAAAGMDTLITPVYNGVEMTTLAARDVPSARAWFDDGGLANFHERKLTLQNMDIPVRTLDSFELSPDAIKIDVQGGELDVIQGALETIIRSRPVLMVESSAGDARISEILEAHRYRRMEFDGTRFVQPIGRLNTFFLPEERIGSGHVAA